MTTKSKTPAKTPTLPVLMTEDVWRSTQLSIAARTGVIKFKDQVYVVVNREGKDLAECSREAEQRGEEFAIPAGEPADLIRSDFQTYYRSLGRTAFLRVLATNAELPPRRLLTLMRQAVRDAKRAEREKKRAEREEKRAAREAKKAEREALKASKTKANK